MSDFLVTVHYDPGMPKHYSVLKCADSREALNDVLKQIGYNPGVKMTVKLLGENDSQTEYCLVHGEE